LKGWPVFFQFFIRSNVPPSVVVPVNKEWAVEAFHGRNVACPGGAGPPWYEGPNAPCGRIAQGGSFETVKKDGIQGNDVLQIDGPGRVAWIFVPLRGVRDDE
jgi:hypothetical protein